MGNPAKYISETPVGAGDVAILWLGGAGFAFKAASGKIVLVDPYLSDALARCYSWKRLPTSPIPFAPAEAAADLVLITHAHEDHLDPDAFPQMAGTQATFVGPASCTTAMRKWGIPASRIVEINCGETHVLHDVCISAVLAHHVSPAGAQTPDAVGYVLDWDGVVVYHSGDTLYHPNLRLMKSYQPDVMLICINGQYGNMNAGEAACLTKEIEPAVVIPMHWGLVAENTADPATFIAALGVTGCRARPVVLAPGEFYVYRG